MANCGFVCGSNLNWDLTGHNCETMKKILKHCFVRGEIVTHWASVLGDYAKYVFKR